LSRAAPGLLVLLLAGSAWAEPGGGQAYRDLSEAGAGFHGPGRERPDPPLPDTVRIGLVGPERGDGAVELRRGVALALEAVNAAGGYRGRPFEVLFGAEDGPWGTAAKRVVGLAYEDRVWAIVGGLDGHHAHLAELISAKLWVPFVTPWSFDRTVDYANVPWVFRCPVDDGRQAEALLRHAAAVGPRAAVMVLEKEREARVGGERLASAARRLGLPPPEPIVYAPTAPAAVVPAVLARRPATVILWGRPRTALPLVDALRAAGYGGPVLAPAGLATPEAAVREGLVVASTVDLAEPSVALDDLAQRYAARFGGRPSALAILAHDALALTLAAVRSAGLNRARIRDALAATDLRLASGRIHFDGLGGNPAEPVLLESTGTGGWRRGRRRGHNEAVGDPFGRPTP